MATNHQHEDKPQFQFRGGHVHPYMFMLGREGKLTFKDVMVFHIVESLVKCNGPGCWATNDYISVAINANIYHVSKIISKLHKLKLLHIYYKDGQRFLETDTSRMTPEREQMEQEGLAKTPRGGREKPQGGVGKNAKHNIMTNTKGNKRKGGNADGLQPSANPTSYRQPKQSNSKPRRNSIPAADTESQDRARLLWDSLRHNNRPVLGRLNTWAVQFQELRDMDKAEQISNVLRWFGKHCGARECERLGLPDIHSARQFRTHYSWIKRICAKAGGTRRYSYDNLIDGPTPLMTEEEKEGL